MYIHSLTLLFIVDSVTDVPHFPLYLPLYFFSQENSHAHIIAKIQSLRYYDWPVYFVDGFPTRGDRHLCKNKHRLNWLPGKMVLLSESMDL